jgi:hypothetical protein
MFIKLPISTSVDIHAIIFSQERWQRNGFRKILSKDSGMTDMFGGNLLYLAVDSSDHDLWPMLGFELFRQRNEINHLQPLVHALDRFPSEGTERRCEASMQEVISYIAPLSRST